MKINPLKNHRILVIDDNRSIHADYLRVFLTCSHLEDSTEEDEAFLFGGKRDSFQLPIFEIDSAYQGKEGLELIGKSLDEERPYALAFIDVFMPPGWDGVETTVRIWEKDPDLYVVLCTAYADYSWEEMSQKLGYSERMVILKKPFDGIEVLQLAVAMTEQWRMDQQAKLRQKALEKLIQERTLALEATNAELTLTALQLKKATEKSPTQGGARWSACSRKKCTMKINPLQNHRILVIDDNHAIHEDIRRILISSSDLQASLAEDEAVLFGDLPDKFPFPIFKIDSAYQGEEGLDLIEKSIREERPYALAFVDVRMPPGWDGVETMVKIWAKYPDLQVVLCTAYSDYSWEGMLRKLGYSERMVILKKPFDAIEVMQLAVAMTKKWRLNLQTKLRLDNLEKIAEARAASLKSAKVDLALTAFQLKEATEKG
jgi:CheY-like chemotaxis protein